MRGVGGMTVMAAALALVASAVLFGATVVDAVRVNGPPGPGVSEGEEVAVPAPSEVEDSPVAEVGEPGAPLQAEGALEAQESPELEGIVYPRVTANEILGAVNNDLFQPDRTPSLERYLLPGERPEAAPQRQQDRRQRGPELRVVGAALMGDQALALIQVDDTLPVVLMVGETLEGYTLASVDAEGATLVMDEETLTLPVVEPLRSSGSSDRRGRSSGTEQYQQTIEALQERVQQMLQQGMRGRGGAGGAAPVPGAVWQVAPGQGAVMRLPDGSFQVVRPGGGQLPGGGQVIVRPRGGGGGGDGR